MRRLHQCTRAAQDLQTQTSETYPYALGSITVLEIFIFLVEPEYNSSILQSSLVSTGDGFFGIYFVLSLCVRKLKSPLNPANGPLPPPSDENLFDLPAPDDPKFKGLLPKNSVKISSADRLKPLDDSFPGGGLSFNPCSPS